MLGKFAPQLKGLPAGMEVMDSALKLPQAAPPAPPPRQPLQMALVLLEREFALKTYDPDSLQAIQEIINGIKSRDPNRLRQIFTLFSAMVREPSPDVQKAFALIRESL